MDPESLAENLANPPLSCRPVGFWFLNHDLEPKEIVRQIREMADKGMGGFLCHARDGLRTNYLSHEWEHVLRVAIDEAEALGLQVWFYDENGYPSGPAGGLLDMTSPVDRTMKSMALLHEREFRGRGIDVEAPKAGPVPVAKAHELLGDVVLPEWSTPRALWTSLETGKTVVREAEKGKRHRLENPFGKDEPCYFCLVAEVAHVACNVTPYAHYPDYFDAELTDDFIRLTHQWHADRFGRHYGKTVKGVFSDNSCANFGYARRAAPWGRDFPRRFEKASGRDVWSVLPGVFNAAAPGARESRNLFWRFTGRAYMESYFRRIKKHCGRNGIHSAGHLTCEDGLGEHVRQAGDYFEVMRSFSLTAVDQLGPKRKGGGLSRLGALDFKNTASAARWNGSPKVMCESFGLASGWELDLGEIRRISGWLFALGVDLFVPHGLYYSIAGSRKWECIPDHLHSPWWPHYRKWTDWIGRLSAANDGHVPRSEIALLYPISSLRAAQELGVRQEGASDRGKEFDGICETMTRAQSALLEAYFDNEVVDEATLAKGSVKDGRLEIPLAGKGVGLPLRAVILPEMRIIGRRTANLFSRWTKKGGRVIALGCLPEEIEERDGTLTRESCAFPVELVEVGRLADSLRAGGIIPEFSVSGVTAEDGREIFCRSWKTGESEFYFLFNANTKEISPEVGIDAGKPLTRIDPEDGARLSFAPGKVRLKAAEGLLVATNLAPARTAAPVFSDGAKDAMELEGDWEIRVLAPNLLPLERWTTESEGPRQVSEASFRSNIDLPSGALIFDLERSRPEIAAKRYAANRLSCKLNGVELAAEFREGRILDRHLYEAPLGALVRKGENRLVVSRDLMLLPWAGQLFPPIVAGAFGVRDGAVDVLPSRMPAGDWRAHGLPRYFGSVVYRRKAELPSGRRLRLRLGRVGNMAVVRIDGRVADTLVTEPMECDVSPFAGRTVDLEIEVVNTAGPLFGPNAAPCGLMGPVTLEMR